MTTLEEKALELFKKHYDYDYRIVLFSGGKDSIVMLHLAKRAWGGFKTIYMDTGISLPENFPFVKKIADEWDLDLEVLRSDIDFWKTVVKWGWPHVKALWCRRVLKIKPLKEWLKSHLGWSIQAIGIRRDESLVRKKSMWYKRDSHLDPKTKYSRCLYPVRLWTKQDIKDYIKKHDLPVNPCYQIYGNAGCYFCPFRQNKRYYRILLREHPELFANIVKAEKETTSGFTAIRGFRMEDLMPQNFLDKY